MNARQKAKYYKRRCEELSKAPIKCTFQHMRTEHLKVRRLVPDEDLYELVRGNQDKEDLFRVLTDELAREFLPMVKKYMTLTTERSPYSPSVEVTADLWIVCR